MQTAVPELRETRLTQLRNYLNQTYGVELARWHDADRRAAITVARGCQISDVVAAVSFDDAGLFQVAVFTSQAWAEYGDPFVSSERDTVERAARFVARFVPETPHP